MTALLKLACGAVLPLLVTALPSQVPTDWRMPFRAPQANVVPPEKMWPHLQAMYSIANTAAPELKHFDDHGVELVDDPRWLEAREALSQQLFDTGYLSSIIRESRNAGDRAIALYAMFYDPNPALVFQMIEHIPGEPYRPLREAAYPRAVEYLRVHMPRRNPGDLAEWQEIRVGPAGQKPPRPGDFSYGFDPAPFFALLALSDPQQHPERDHAQALWFLGQCVEIRPELATPYLDHIQQELRVLLQSEEPLSRDAAKDFVLHCDPENRPAPESDEAEELEAWLDAVIYTALPPIRPISSGHFDLYPSEDLEQVIAIGTAGLEDGSLGEAAVGQTKDSDHYRGFRIGATPPPLDKLDLPPGTTLTHINGVVVASASDLLGTLRKLPEGARSLLVEYVDLEGRRCAREYRLR